MITTMNMSLKCGGKDTRYADYETDIIRTNDETKETRIMKDTKDDEAHDAVMG